MIEFFRRGKASFLRKEGRGPGKRTGVLLAVGVLAASVLLLLSAIPGKLGLTSSRRTGAIFVPGLSGNSGTPGPHDLGLIFEKAFARSTPIPRSPARKPAPGANVDFGLLLDAAYKGKTSGVPARSSAPKVALPPPGSPNFGRALDKAFASKKKRPSAPLKLPAKTDASFGAALDKAFGAADKSSPSR